MSLEMTDRVRPLVEAVKTFITERVMPVDHEFMQEVDKGDRWTLTDRQNEIIDDGHAWIDALQKRNLMTYTYDERRAIEAEELIRKD